MLEYLLLSHVDITAKNHSVLLWRVVKNKLDFRIVVFWDSYHNQNSDFRYRHPTGNTNSRPDDRRRGSAYPRTGRIQYASDYDNDPPSFSFVYGVENVEESI